MRDLSAADFATTTDTVRETQAAKSLQALNTSLCRVPASPGVGVQVQRSFRQRPTFPSTSNEYARKLSVSNAEPKYTLHSMPGAA